MFSCVYHQVLKVMAKKLVRKALEMLRKLATQEVEDEEVCLLHVGVILRSVFQVACFFWFMCPGTSRLHAGFPLPLRALSKFSQR